jgi:hypothetical protein
LESIPSVAISDRLGRRAFKGESSIETMNAIVKEEPPELTDSGLPVVPAPSNWRRMRLRLKAPT